MTVPNKIVDDCQDLLYHYTDPNGFIGIVRNRKLWASSAFYMNDSSEFAEAREGKLNKLLRAHNDVQQQERDTKNPWERSTNRRLKHLQYVFRDIKADHLLVSSFSEAGDILSQWRGYGNNGYGYAIGFRRKDLIFPGFRMVRCIYKEEEKDPVRATILNTCREVGEQEKTDANERILANIEALNNAVANALALKHEGFSEEREWRLVGHSTDSCPLKFRTRKNRVVCYCELPLPPITRIFLGPCQDCDAEQVARKACESLLGYIPPIKPSQIPYRI